MAREVYSDPERLIRSSEPERLYGKCSTFQVLRAWHTAHLSSQNPPPVDGGLIWGQCVPMASFSSVVDSLSSKGPGRAQNASSEKKGRIGTSSPVLIQNMPKFIAKAEMTSRRYLAVPTGRTS